MSSGIPARGITSRSRSKHDGSSLTRSRNEHPVLEPGSTGFDCRRRSSRRTLQTRHVEAGSMRRDQGASAALLLAAVTVAAYGQSQPPATDPEIVTDRPDITESSVVVPKGSLQFENGLTWT